MYFRWTFRRLIGGQRHAELDRGLRSATSPGLCASIERRKPVPVTFVWRLRVEGKRSTGPVQTERRSLDLKSLYSDNLIPDRGDVEWNRDFSAPRLHCGMPLALCGGLNPKDAGRPPTKFSCLGNERVKEATVGVSISFTVLAKGGKPQLVGF